MNKLRMGPFIAPVRFHFYLFIHSFPVVLRGMQVLSFPTREEREFTHTESWQLCPSIDLLPSSSPDIG